MDGQCTPSSLFLEILVGIKKNNGKIKHVDFIDSKNCFRFMTPNFVLKENYEIHVINTHCESPPR